MSAGFHGDDSEECGREADRTKCHAKLSQAASRCILLGSALARQYEQGRHEHSPVVQAPHLAKR